MDTLLSALDTLRQNKEFYRNLLHYCSNIFNDNHIYNYMLQSMDYDNNKDDYNGLINSIRVHI